MIGIFCHVPQSRTVLEGRLLRIKKQCKIVPLEKSISANFSSKYKKCCMEKRFLYYIYKLNICKNKKKKS